ncbi:hypothetical protein [Bizionia sp.]|uniref:hypothetical protein n=1 Tax=Bizionia sp. TaxID=1954480 RepID=UPI003A8F137D
MNKAINITQAIKDKNHDFINYGLGIKEFTNSKFPKRFNGVENVSGYYQTKTHLHEQDGFWEVEKLPLGENQKYGAIERKGSENKYQYPVIDLTDEEIQSRIISNSEAVKEQRIKDIQDALTLQETYNETDIQTVLDNMDLYPMWEVDMEVSTSNINGIPERYKDFNNDNELVLWEVIQDHTTQSDWRPKDVPALFKRVELDGVIPVFVQPTGDHDAYDIGDQVHFPTETDPVYESLINANTYSPLAYPAGWQIIP